MLRLLQVCNVGNIVGGTAACAWSVTRALPDCHHVVAFLSTPTAATRDAFAGSQIERWSTVCRDDVARIAPDLIILHNTSRARVASSLEIPTLAYGHSQGALADADLKVYCSRWLANRCGAGEADVLYQGVPRPTLFEEERRTFSRAMRHTGRQSDGRLRVGRICTPTSRKWPAALVPFTASLAERFPQIDWEFVGAPPSLQPDLHEACQGRCRFFPASWQARGRLTTWDVLLYHHPTLTESFGRTVAEAMRAGCVPIVDARGGFLEQITPQSGFVCEREEECAGALSEILDVRKRRGMADIAQQIADEKFSLASFRKNLLSRFEQLARAA